MIYLLLSILASTLIFICFKLFDRFKVNTLQAIVFNYITACSCGIIMYEETIQIDNIIHSEWFYGAIALGFLFISIFITMAITTQKNGLSVASVATKMSVVIPIGFGIYMYNESTNPQKILGIVLALFAVYLAFVKSKSKINFKKNLLFPLILFLGSGITDTSIKYLETNYVAENGIPLFSATIFCFAAIIGFLIILFKVTKNEIKFDYKSLVGGLCLGLVNYASIYYLLKALHFEDSESSTIFTINNVAIVMLSTLLGLILFREHISKQNWIGIVLAIISILLLTLA